MLIMSPRQEEAADTAEVNEIICWLTGYSREQLETELKEDRLRDFFPQAPAMNPPRELITGTVCGVQVENAEEPLMREIRYMDSLIDELPKAGRWTRFCAPDW